MKFKEDFLQHHNSQLGHFSKFMKDIPVSLTVLVLMKAFFIKASLTLLPSPPQTMTTKKRL